MSEMRRKSPENALGGRVECVVRMAFGQETEGQKSECRSQRTEDGPRANRLSSQRNHSNPGCPTKTMDEFRFSCLHCGQHILCDSFGAVVKSSARPVSISFAFHRRRAAGPIQPRTGEECSWAEQRLPNAMAPQALAAPPDSTDEPA